MPPPLPRIDAAPWPAARLPTRTQIRSAIACPFPLRLNRHAAEAERLSLHWLAWLGIARGARRLAVLGRARLTTLVAGFYPLAGFEQLSVASDYICWAFALDDIADETPVGLRPGRLAALFASFDLVMRGAPLGAHATPLDRGLHDILARVAALTTPAQMRDFIEGNRAYFDAMFWEAGNRARGVPPDEPTYLAMRPAAGAVPSFFALIEPFERIALPPEVRRHGAVSRLAPLAGDLICWINDLLSYEKERATGDFHNLVMVYERHRSLPPGAAAFAAVSAVNAGVAELERLAAALPSFGPAQDRALSRYLEVLRSVIRVTLHWTHESTRYAPA
jgi:hypothetical protein